MLHQYSFRSELYLLSLRVLHAWLTIAAFSLSFCVPLLPSAAWFPIWFIVRILTAGRLTLHLSTNTKRLTTLLISVNCFFQRKTYLYFLNNNLGHSTVHYRSTTGWYRCSSKVASKPNSSMISLKTKINW